MLKKKENNDNQFSKIKSIIGQDAVFEGTLQAKETTRVDGLIKGDVKIDTVLVLGLTGKIVGNVQAATIMIGGTVEGDLVATDKITISATGKVTGNLHTKKLVVDENAVFFGQCFMGDHAPARPEPETAQTPAPAPLKAAEQSSQEYRRTPRAKAADPGEYPKAVRSRTADEIKSADDGRAAGE